MKKMSKVLALVLALVLVMGLATTAFADDPSYTITVNGKEGETYTAYKIFSVTYSGTGSNGLPTAYNYYITNDNPWHPVISANAATYDLTLTADPNNSAVFSVEAGPNFNAVAFANFLSSNIPTNAASVSGTIAEDTDTDDNGSVTLNVTEQGAGYYFVTTTLGTICNLNTTTPTVTVEEKNSVPESDKNITGVVEGVYETNGDNAIAQLGTDVTFTGEFDIADGAVNYVYHDIMSSGLDFNDESVTVKVTYGGTTTEYASTNNWTLDEEPINEFTITFDNDFIATLTPGSHVTIEYTATVTSGALQSIPGSNEAYLTYGNSGETVHTVVKVWNASIAVNKTDGTNPLAGAGFILAKTDATGAITGYYNRVGNDVNWVATEGEASEYITNADGKLTTDGTETSFNGLANGTYLLIEKTVPSGYTRAANQAVTIHDDNYTAQNLSHTATVVNSSGSVLPTTGGMGTTLLYTIGGLMAVAAVILLITKKRMANNY